MTQVRVRDATSVFDVHEETAPEDLRLEAAFLFYRSKSGRSVYASQHPVLFPPGMPNAPVLGAGSAPSKKSITELAKSVAKASAFAGFVPERLLYTHPDAMIWWCPPRDRHMWFKTNEGQIGERNATIPQPGLIFAAVDEKIYVFATTESTRPGPDTNLFKAPYFNVWDGGQVCVGNADFPSVIDASALDGYEQAFFGSRFTHPNDKKLVKWKGGSIPMWKHLLDHPTTDWDWPRWLIPTKKTLAATIKEISK